MKQGRTLVELAQEIERRRSAKRDFVADSRAIGMDLAGNEPVLSINGVEDAFPLNEHAHGQLAARLDIPKKYYDRMRSTEPTLLAHNANVWLGRSNDRRMVRTIDGYARAILSDRYQRIENEEIAEMALPILHEQPDLQVISCEVTEKNLYIKAVFPRIQGEVKRGDVIQAGVVVRNSEVGSGAASASALDFRLVCLNGAISTETVRAYHVGRRITETAEHELPFADDTREADDRVILLKLRDMIRACADPERFERRLDKMREAAGMQITGDVVKAVELLAKRHTLAQTEQSSVLRHLIEGGDLTKWGLQNAVTAAAQDEALDYERATELEVLGGKLLELPVSEWRELAMAA